MPHDLNKEFSPTRREFIRTSALGLLAIGISGCASAKKLPAAKEARVGSNIYGWGQYAQREKRPLDQGEVMKALRDCGYDYLEAFLNVERPDENAAFADQLRAHGLKPTSMYAGLRLHEAAMAREAVKKLLAAAEICQKCGFEIISCNPAPIGREKTDAELETQNAALTELGQGLHALGLKLGIHHHLPEMAAGAREFHSVFRNTSPSVVGWCYDVHWIWKGGIMPVDALRLYGDRVVTWHLRQSRDNIWWEDLDAGDIDYGKVAEYARRHNLPQRYTVELALEPGTKISRSVVENHCRSREFVKRVFGV